MGFNSFQLHLFVQSGELSSKTENCKHYGNYRIMLRAMSWLSCTSMRRNINIHKLSLWLRIAPWSYDWTRYKYPDDDDWGQVRSRVCTDCVFIFCRIELRCQAGAPLLPGCHPDPGLRTHRRSCCCTNTNNLETIRGSKLWPFWRILLCTYISWGKLTISTLHFLLSQLYISWRLACVAASVLTT